MAVPLHPQSVRVIVALEPPMYGEVLAFSIGQRRPHAQVTLLDSPDALAEEVALIRPHLVVANRVPSNAKEDAFWVEVSEGGGGRGPRRLDARISADGYSRSVREVRIEHVLAALDRAAEDLVVPGGAEKGSHGA
jgi:hypothetical protein